MESREGLPAIVARRVAAGRIAQMGYGDTWRWRMEGEGRAVEEHRSFGSRTVGLAAAAPSMPRRAMIEGVPVPRVVEDDNPAPRAALVHALGVESESVSDGPSAPRTLPSWVGLLLLALLLAEWASRRGRGAA